MIYAVALKEQTIVLMISEKDVEDLRAGHTKFVDKRMMKGKKFDSIIISLHKTDDESIKVLKLGNEIFHNPGIEATCRGCQGDIKKELLFEGKCIVCWAKQAKAECPKCHKRVELGSDGQFVEHDCK